LIDSFVHLFIYEIKKLFFFLQQQQKKDKEREKLLAIYLSEGSFTDTGLGLKSFLGLVQLSSFWA